MRVWIERVGVVRQSLCRRDTAAPKLGRPCAATPAKGVVPYFRRFAFDLEWT
jgi:hypothetical protein